MTKTISTKREIWQVISSRQPKLFYSGKQKERREDVSIPVSWLLFHCCHKDHDQKLLGKKAFDWGNSFRGLEPIPAEQGHGSRSSESSCDPQGGGREHTGNGMSLLHSQSSSPVTHLPLKMPHLLILPNQVTTQEKGCRK